MTTPASLSHPDRPIIVYTQKARLDRFKIQAAANKATARQALESGAATNKPKPMSEAMQVQCVGLDPTFLAAQSSSIPLLVHLCDGFVK